MGTCLHGMRLEPILERGSKEDPALGQSCGKGWQGGMEEAGDIFQHRLCGGWEWVSADKLLQKRVNATASGAGLVPAVPCSSPLPGKGPGPDGGQGRVLERRPSTGGQEPVPTSQTNSRDQGRGCHSTRDMEPAGLLAEGRGGGCSPPGCQGGENSKPKASGRTPEEQRDMKHHVGWPRRVRGRRAPSWQQDTAGGPGLARAGAVQGLSPGAGRDGDRDGGGGCHDVAQQGHLIPPAASSRGCSTPTPALLMLPEATRALSPHQASYGSL